MEAAHAWRTGGAEAVDVLDVQQEVHAVLDHDARGQQRLLLQWPLRLPRPSASRRLAILPLRAPNTALLRATAEHG